MNVLGQKGIHKRKPKVKEEDGEVSSISFLPTDEVVTNA